MPRVITILGLMVLTALAAGCGAGGGRPLSLVGSTSVQPFAEVLAEEYEAKHPEHKVEVQGGGSTAGLVAAANGLADVGTCSRELTAEEAKQFTPVVIARDGLAVIVHPSNPVKGLTKEQIRKVFAGRIRNWKEVGGRDLAIWPITREEGSGTRESFMHLVMGKETISRRALVQESNGSVRELVRSDPSAIGYISLGLVSEVKALDIDGVTPSAKAVVEGRYTLARPFLFVVKGAPTPDAQAFIDFVLSAEGQKVLETEGLVGVK